MKSVVAIAFGLMLVLSQPIFADEFPLVGEIDALATAQPNLKKASTCGPYFDTLGIGQVEDVVVFFSVKNAMEENAWKAESTVRDAIKVVIDNTREKPLVIMRDLNDVEIWISARDLKSARCLGPRAIRL